MTLTAATALWVALAYLIGSIPFGVLVGRMKGVDPRASGSGNIGATNIFRILGPGPGMAVLLLDMLKGFAPIWLAARTAVLYPVPAGTGSQIVSTRLDTLGMGPAVLVFVGIAAIMGHSYSMFLRGKGGKSVATTGGVLFALDWRVGLLALIVLIVALAFTRYVSVGSTAAAVSIPIGFGFFQSGTTRLVPYVLFGTLAMLLVLYKHRANYKRLAQGTEPKFGGKTKHATD